MKALIVEAGCNGYIEKPIDPETFMSQVGEYFNGKTSEDNKS